MIWRTEWRMIICMLLLKGNINWRMEGFILGACLHWHFPNPTAHEPFFLPKSEQIIKSTNLLVFLDLSIGPWVVSMGVGCLLSTIDKLIFKNYHLAMIPRTGRRGATKPPPLNRILPSLVASCHVARNPNIRKFITRSCRNCQPDNLMRAAGVTHNLKARRRCTWKGNGKKLYTIKQ